MTGKRSQNSPIGSPLSGNISDGSSKDHDRFLPIANVSRIMKKSLPANAKISKEAKETVQECVSEFISFITGEASDKCQREKRKTINGDDLLWAMTTLGFENYVSPLKVYLNKYRENEGEKNSMAREDDHPFPTNSTSNYFGEISKVSDYSISTKADFYQNCRNGFYPLEDAKMTPKNYADPGSVFGYGDNGISDVEGSSKRVMATNLQYGVEW